MATQGELSVPEALHMAPVIRSLYDKEWQGLVNTFNAAYPALRLDGLDTIKVQYNACVVVAGAGHWNSAFCISLSFSLTFSACMQSLAH